MNIFVYFHQNIIFIILFNLLKLGSIPNRTKLVNNDLILMDGT